MYFHYILSAVCYVNCEVMELKLRKINPYVKNKMLELL